MGVQEYADALTEELPKAADALTPEGELVDETEFARAWQEISRR